MMRRMCMGQCAELQDVLRFQRLNQSSYNFLSNVVNYLISIEPELENAIVKKDWEIVDGAFRAFSMIGDAMAGPNRENQKALSDSSTGIFDLADRILARLRYKPVTENDKRAEVWLANDFRQKIKSAVARTLIGFLEGVSSDEIPNQMLALLNWSVLVDQMRECYTIWKVCMQKSIASLRLSDVYGCVNNYQTRAHMLCIRIAKSVMYFHACIKFMCEFEYKQRRTDIEKPDLCIEEGTSFYCVMVHAKHYDRGNFYIQPAFELISPLILKFYQERTGYIEMVTALIFNSFLPLSWHNVHGRALSLVNAIKHAEFCGLQVRHDLLERLYFRVPDVCLPGGPLDNHAVSTFMYKTEREDYDKKNLDFIGIAQTLTLAQSPPPTQLVCAHTWACTRSFSRTHTHGGAGERVRGREIRKRRPRQG